VTLVSLALDLVLEAGVSLRGAAAVLERVGQQFFPAVPTPSASSIRLWIQRLGCYALRQPLCRDTPWVWLIDHTMQIGAHKLFVVVGCPLDRVPFGQRSLALRDLQLIALTPMDGSSQEKVAAVLEEAAARTGPPRQIVSDDASDLLQGVTRFQQRHPETTRVHDVAHHTANLLKHFWDGDPRWHALVRQMQATSDRLRQTKRAHLLAPKLRRKARFLNVARFVRYASWLGAELQKAAPRAEVEQEYAWLREFAAELPHWREQLRLSQLLLRRVRIDGLHSWSEDAVVEDWGEVLPHPTTHLLVGRLKGYLQACARRVRGSETLVGSTEVLESALGKQKRMVAAQAESGLTGLSLALGAMLGSSGESEVRAALEAVPEKESSGWIQRAFGHTVQWLRRQLFKQVGAEAAAQEPPSSPSVPKPG
jgi:hypothetical protein